MTDRKEIEQLSKKTGAKVVYDKDGLIDFIVHNGKTWPIIAFAEWAREQNPLYCPWCGCNSTFKQDYIYAVELINFGDEWCVQCNWCGASGPISDTPDGAKFGFDVPHKVERE